MRKVELIVRRKRREEMFGSPLINKTGEQYEHAQWLKGDLDNLVKGATTNFMAVAW